MSAIFQSIYDFPENEEFKRAESTNLEKSFQTSFKDCSSLISSAIHIKEQDLDDLRREADEGDASAQIKLGIVYEKGHIVPQSCEQAFHYFQLAANQNHPLGLYFLAKCFILGAGTTKSIKKAFDYYRLADNHGYSCNLWDIVGYLYDEGINRKTIARFLKSLLSRDIDSRAEQYKTLGQLFEEGTILIHAPKAALYYYKLAAEQGCTSVQRTLGDIYFNGFLGTEKNEQLAVHYYLLSRKLSTVTHLAKQYEVTAPQKAFHYYQLIYRTKRGLGTSYVGDCYEKGVGVKISFRTAIDYYKIAYKEGLRSSCYELGYCLEQFESQEVLNQAIYYYQEGAQYDSALCQFRLGELFE